MKKLKLQALELGAKEILTREQLKNLMGGAGSGFGESGEYKCCRGTECSSCVYISNTDNAKCPTEGSVLTKC